MQLEAGSQMLPHVRAGGRGLLGCDWVLGIGVPVPV